MKIKTLSLFGVVFLCATLSGEAWTANTNPYAGNLSGYQKCVDLGATSVMNDRSGFALCKMRLDSETGPATYALAIFYRGVLLRGNPQYFDEYSGVSIPKVISVGVKINKGNGDSFMVYKMKTRQNSNSNYYAQLVIHTQDKFFNEYSAVTFKRDELPQTKQFFSDIFDSNGILKNWKVEFYFLDNENNYDSNLSVNYHEVL